MSVMCGVGLTTLAEATPQFIAENGTHLEHWFGEECSGGHHNPFLLSPLYPSHFLPTMLQDHSFITFFFFIYILQTTINIFNDLHVKTYSYLEVWFLSQMLMILCLKMYVPVQNVSFLWQKC